MLFSMAGEGMIFSNLDIQVPGYLVQAREENKISSKLFDLLTRLDKQGESSNTINMRKEMIKHAAEQGFAEVENELNGGKSLTEDIVRILIYNRVELCIHAEIGDEDGIYKDMGFSHIGENTTKPVQREPVPLIFHESWSPIYIRRTAFNKQYLPHFDEQSFIPWVQDSKSVDFIAEYRRYIANPTNYPGSPVKDRNDLGNNGHRRSISPNTLKHMEQKLDLTFKDILVYSFFKKDNDHQLDLYKPTHDLVCQMTIIAPGNAGHDIKHPVPGLSTSHLGDPSQHTAQFDYYSGLLVDTYLENQPLDQELSLALQELTKMIQTKHSLLGDVKLTDGDIDIISDTIDNGLLIRIGILEVGQPMVYELTIRGALLLYMCCPKI